MLEADGERLVELPLTERQDRLRALIDRRSATVRVSESFDDGAAFVPGAAEFGLDAFVAAMGAPGSAGAGAGVPASAGMGAQQAQHQTMGTGSTPAPAQQQPQPRPQDFDWIEGFLSGSGGASTEPVPSTAEMDANWQSLVDQLGL